MDMYRDCTCVVWMNYLEKLPVVYYWSNIKNISIVRNNSVLCCTFLILTGIGSIGEKGLGLLVMLVIGMLIVIVSMDMLLAI